MVTEGSQQGDRELDFHPVMGERWEITQSAVDSPGELFESTVWLDARTPGPPPHAHADSEESIEVLEGSLEVFKDGAWVTLRPGETASVPAGAPHTFRNDSNELVKILIRFQPAGRSEEFFRHMLALTREGKIKRLPPKEPRSAIYAAMVFVSYPDVARVTGPLSGLFKSLALIGKALRFKL